MVFFSIRVRHAVTIPTPFASLTLNTMSSRVVIDLTLDDDLEVEYQYTEIRDNTLRPPPPDDDKPSEYIVERILKEELTAAGWVYLVKWFGSPIEESSWIHETNMNCEDALAHFQKCKQQH